MVISEFFIRRPKFAFVISIVITLAGLLSMPLLPVAQFPDISPPIVQVSAFYPGANAEVVRDTVAGPLEVGINGVEGMIYMSSKSAGDGSYSLSITFAVGTDADMAQVRVQNRVQRAMPKLPEEVKRLGVSVDKRSSNMLMVVNLLSPKGTFDPLFLSNYASINVVDQLARIDGLSDVRILGDLEYGMRIWMNPDHMTALGITTQDVINAIREQNVQVAATSKAMKQVTDPIIGSRVQFTQRLIDLQFGHDDRCAAVLAAARQSGAAPKIHSRQDSRQIICLPLC
jgi:HAE1 family hydrophobic/amphiphilic exporter-1